MRGLLTRPAFLPLGALNKTANLTHKIMPVRYDFSNVENSDELFIELEEDIPADGLKKGDEILNVKSRQLIWVTMIIGMDRITAENYKVFYSRLHYVERLYGSFVTRGGEDEPYTLEEIERHIGMTTNASRMNKREFLKNQRDRWERDIGPLS